MNLFMIKGVPESSLEAVLFVLYASNRKDPQEEEEQSTKNLKVRYCDYDRQREDHMLI